MTSTQRQQEQPSPIPEGMQVRVLTALAKGAIAVVQISGTEALVIAEKVFRRRRGHALGQAPASHMVHGDFVDASGQVFDEGLAICGSASDLPWVEFNLHGGVRIVQRLVQRTQELGAALVKEGLNPTPGHDPDTPPDRAFEWLSPLDRWMQACLVEAATQRVVHWLAGQPALWREQVRTWQGRVQQGDLQAVLDEVQALVAQGLGLGQAWRGRTIAIIGPPNVGKSTLANRLAGRDVSLVADVPGTTRDWVGEPIAVQGWPVTIVDTAGLRAAADEVEAQGVARAEEQAGTADVRLLVLDAGDPDSQAKDILLDRLDLKAYDVVVYNKCDLPCRWPGGGREAGLVPTREAFVSSLTGQGWSKLEQEISIACGFTVLHEQKPLVFCAELLSRLSDLASSLRSRQILKAQVILESL